MNYRYYKTIYLLPILMFLQHVAMCQNLQPDSLMVKIEQFGDFLLYRNHDSTYIKNYGESVAVKLIGVNKISYFRIIDKENNSSLRYRPDRQLNLGLGVSYKWFAMDLAFNVGIAEKSGFNNSRSFDFQGAIFSSKQYISALYQNYYGYQLSKVKGLPANDIYNANREDIRTVFLDLQYLFALNYDKFSLKAPFIHNERQLQQAGSFLLGASFNMYNVIADSSMVPQSIQSGFNQNLWLTDVNSSSVAINFGYMYTFVWQKYFYVTLSIVPGLGINYGDFGTTIHQPYKTHLYLGYLSMNSVGYNSDKLFGGIKFISNTFRTNIAKKQKVLTGSGNFKLFFGYRF